MKLSYINAYAPIIVLAALAACGGDGSGTTQPDGPPELPEVLSVKVSASTKRLNFSWNAIADAEYYRLLEDPDGLSGFSQIGDDIPAGTVIASRDIAVHLHDWTNARYMVEACSVTICTGSDVVTATDVALEAIGYFKASNTDTRDFYGTSVTISADGRTLAVGAPGESSSATGINGAEASNSAESAGAVYVYSFDGIDWYQEAYVKASNSDARDNFGASVALSADGETLVIGAPGEASRSAGIDGEQIDNSAESAGAVYVYRFRDSGWNQEAYVKASNTDPLDRFGAGLALSANGNTLAVGGVGEDSNATGINGNQDDNSVAESGAVYLFRFDGSDWFQQAYLKASNADPRDDFGTSLALSADGNILAVGAPYEDSSATGINGDQANNSAIESGAAYLFQFDGADWFQRDYIKASNTGGWDGDSDVFGDNFGATIALSADGDTMAIGAPSEQSLATGIDGDEQSNGFGNAGAVYVFDFDGIEWNQQAYVKASNNTGRWVGDFFGSSVSVNAKGDMLTVGALGEASNSTGINGYQTDRSVEEAGAVYLFRFDGATWFQETYIKASNTDSRPALPFDDDYSVAEYFGSSVSLSADGNELAVGAPGENSPARGIGGDQESDSADHAGAVYVY